MDYAAGVLGPQGITSAKQQLQAWMDISPDAAKAAKGAGLKVAGKNDTVVVTSKGVKYTWANTAETSTKPTRSTGTVTSPLKVIKKPTVTYGSGADYYGVLR